MHRKPESYWFPVDSELERTLRSLRKVSRAERPPIQDTMEDFWRPVIQAEYSTVKQPAIEANKFELKPALITMVQ